MYLSMEIGRISFFVIVFVDLLRHQNSRSFILDLGDD